MEYEVGDTVVYVIGTSRKTAKVAAKVPSIEDTGCPGFDGVEVNIFGKPTKRTVWGYDRQIIKVEPQPEFQRLIDSGEFEFGWGLDGLGSGWVEIIDAETDESIECAIEWGVYGSNVPAHGYNPAEYAEGELLRVTVEEFGRTYDVTEEVRNLIPADEFQESALETASEAAIDAEADRGDYLYDQWKDGDL